MPLDELKISRAIIESYSKKMLDCLDVDVAIVGAGPAGMVAAYYLAKAGKKVSLYERKLSLGGGMWGGGMMFNKIVVQECAKEILDEFDIRCEKFEDDYYVADSVESVAMLCGKATQAGANMFNCISAEDVMVRDKKVTGLVLNWTSVELTRMHVDPIAMRSKFVIDATGHPAEVTSIVKRKSGIELNTPTGELMGEGSMWADVAEDIIENNTKEICDGMYVAGMCANAVFGGPRMGPIFGGMLLSGRKVAQEIIARLDAGDF